MLHKVPDELGDIGRGIYKYKVVEGDFVLKDDLSDWNHNQIASFAQRRAPGSDWTQTEDCPLDTHKKEMYRAYRRFLLDFPKNHDPEIDGSLY